MPLSGHAMVRNLLLWGMLAGLSGGILAAGFAGAAGEPALADAIAFERTHAGHVHEDDGLVSRDVQSTAGLLTATTLYGVALGGLFALAFAFAYGRVGSAGPARTAGWLGLVGFAVVFLVPFLKYPANPPAIGDAATVGERTQLFLIMIAASVLIAVAALRLRARLTARWSARTAGLAAAGAYLALAAAFAVTIPAVNEVPPDFPDSTLWRFRAAAVGMQAVLWGTMGFVFAVGVRRLMARRLPVAARQQVV